MNILQRHILILGLMACIVTGCQTVERQRSTQEASDVVQYAGDPPVWIFIPSPSITGDQHGYPAQIVVPPHRGYATNRIEVVVNGEVVVPGVVRLYPSSTVLQAIGCAGGFTAFAYNRRLRITKTSGQHVTLHLRSCRTADSRLVWYDTKKDADSGTDYVLDTGDEISIGRTVF